jgi:hypothetical protein
MSACVVCNRSRREARFAPNARACLDCAPVGFRWCPRCTTVKPLADYHQSKNATKPPGLCRACNIARSAAHHREHREDHARRAREWRKRNPEKQRELNRKWYEKNRERQNVLAKSANRRASRLLSACRKRAREAGIPWDSSPAFRVDIQRRLDCGVCELTGLPFDFVSRGCGPRAPFTPSIDRIIPSLGYVPSNVRVVCWAVNAALGDWGIEVAREVARRLLEVAP